MRALASRFRPRGTIPSPDPQPDDADASSPSAPNRGWKQFGLIFLCSAWVLLGLFGRDPWKTEDAIAFGIANEMLARADWLVPHVAAEPFLEQPPLVPWLAAAGIAAFSPLLTAPDASRIGVGLLLALLLALTWLAADRLGGRALRWMPVLIVVGSVGLFDRSHQLSPDLGLAVAVALAMWVVALGERASPAAGVLLGIAVGMGFLSAGGLGLAWTLGPAVLVPLAGAPWRSARYKWLLVIALVVAAPLVLAWPWLLYQRSPELFTAWWRADSLLASLPLLGGNAAPHPEWLLRNLVWVAWPAVPLIAWTLWIRGRGFNGGMSDRAIVVPGVFAAWMLLWVVVSPHPRLMQFLPLMAPLAILAAVEIDSMKRGQSAALDWFGILTFGMIAIALWAFWIDAYINGMSARVAILLRDATAGYGTSFSLRAMLAALLLTILWVILVRPARRSNRRAVLNWAAGITLIWGLSATIWMPYLNSRRTYDTLGQALSVHRAAPPSCIARRDLGDAQRALFYHFGGVVTVDERAPQAAVCDQLLVQYGRTNGTVPTEPGYALQWQGARRGDASERYVLFRRIP